MGRKLEVVFADTQSEVQPAIDKVKGLLYQDKVDHLIGIISIAVYGLRSRDADLPPRAAV